jgi:hypothetical protein
MQHKVPAQGNFDVQYSLTFQYRRSIEGHISVSLVFIYYASATEDMSARTHYLNDIDGDSKSCSLACGDCPW